MSQKYEEIWFLIEDYARKLKAVDNWSGKVVEKEYITPAYESENRLKTALASLKDGSKLNKLDDEIWELAEDYAKKLQSVDFWSGTQKNSSILMPAYESQDRLKKALDSINREPGGEKSKFKYQL